MSNNCLNDLKKEIFTVLLISIGNIYFSRFVDTDFFVYLFCLSVGFFSFIHSIQNII